MCYQYVLEEDFFYIRFCLWELLSSDHGSERSYKCVGREKTYPKFTGHVSPRRLNFFFEVYFLDEARPYSCLKSASIE